MPGHTSSKEARLRFEKTRTKQLNIRLNDRTDADLIEWINGKHNKRSYILNLIREDIKNSKKN